MKNLASIVLALLLVAFAAGCCHCRAYQRKTRRPLTGTSWQLIQLGGRSIHPEVGQYVVVFSAEEGRITGRGACNDLTGSFRSDDTRALHIGPLAATRMSCPDLGTEQAFVRALESATHYDMDGPMLLLLSDGELRAVFQAIDE